MKLATKAALGSLGIAAGWAAVYHAAYAVRSQVLGRTDWRGRADTNAVALTFDDGPSHDTEAVLGHLERFGAHGTFFMMGRHVERDPTVAREVNAAGHEIGNHSYSHPIYLFRSPRETRRQLERTQEIVAATVGAAPRLARPPCGVRTPAYFSAARALGLRTVMWDVAGFDWKRRSAREIAADVLGDVVPGSIVLLHDGDSQDQRDRRATAAAVPIIVEGLRERGLRIAPLAELLGI